MAYRILTLKEALNEGKEKVLPMPVYSDSIVRDRATLIWLYKLMYDNGMAVAVLDKDSTHYNGYAKYINEMEGEIKERTQQIKEGKE